MEDPRQDLLFFFFFSPLSFFIFPTISYVWKVFERILNSEWVVAALAVTVVVEWGWEWEWLKRGVWWGGKKSNGTPERS